MTNNSIGRQNGSFTQRAIMLLAAAALGAFCYKMYNANIENKEKAAQPAQPEQRHEETAHQQKQAEVQKIDIKEEEIQAILAEHKRRQEEKTGKCETQDCKGNSSAYEDGTNTAVSSINKSRAERLYFEGLKCFNSQDYLKAKEYWTESYKLDPENDSKLGLKRIEDILNSQKSPEDKSQAAKLYLEGLKCFNNKDYLKTKEIWTKAIQLDPKSEDIKLGLKRVDQILEFQNK